MRPVAVLSLYWRVCLINALVFAVGTLVLVLSPATVSARALWSEVVVLAVGVGVILVTNGLLLRTSLAPLDRLIRTMESIDTPGRQRLDPVRGVGTVARLVRSFNAMADRLEVERRTSNARALAAQEAERHRIAQELHDQVGQSLTVVLLDVKRALDRAPDDLADDLRRVQTNVRSGLDEVRDVARRLRPGVLDELGLSPALRALATDFSSGTGIEVRRGIGSSLPALTPEAELVVYRVAQEALTNVARHSRAGSVDLQLTRQGPAVRLRVADDGIGLPRGADGAGLRGMRERALLAAAELAVGRGSDGGTELTMLVPAAVDG
jgi:two-component system sensor histidine kinase UhpB